MRPAFWTVVVVGGLRAAGCSGYGGGDGCTSSDECSAGYTCVVTTGRCRLVQTAPAEDGFGCASPNACYDGETCGADGVCRPGSCHFHGCIDGYECAVLDGVFSCVEEGFDAGVVRDASRD